MSPTDPSFADTELSSTVSLLPLGVTRRSTRPPIPFPNLELVHRERQRSAIAERARTLAATQEALRIAEAAAAAYANGKIEGDRHGFRRGWTRGTRWGIGVGAFATLVIGAIGILAALAWLTGRLPF
jgi:hypothetical protein